MLRFPSAVEISHHLQTDPKFSDRKLFQPHEYYSAKGLTRSLSKNFENRRVGSIADTQIIVADSIKSTNSRSSDISVNLKFVRRIVASLGRIFTKKS